MNSPDTAREQANPPALVPPPPGTPLRSYLARYFDGGLTIPEDLNEAVIAADEIDRLTQSLSIVLYAASLPRRLGSDAADEELALDKKRGRRTSWALNQSFRQWTRKRQTSARLSDEIRIAGAQLVWSQFKAEHSAQLNERLRLVSTWALMADEPLFGKRAAVKLNNELNWVSYALRD